MFDGVQSLVCPDCDHPCPVSFALLTDDGQIVYLTTCPVCRDRATIRCRQDLPSADYEEAANRGLSIVTYQRRAS